MNKNDKQKPIPAHILKRASDTITPIATAHPDIFANALKETMKLLGAEDDPELNEFLEYFQQQSDKKSASH